MTCSIHKMQHLPKNKTFQHQVVIWNEKWIMYDNRKRSLLLHINEPRNTVQNQVYIKRSTWSLFDAQMKAYSNTADAYCKILNDIRQKYSVKQQDNAKPNIAQITGLKIRKLELEALTHPLNSPDLEHIDFHFLRKWN